MSLKKIIRKNIEDSAVTEPKIANEAVTAEKLGTDFITGLDELTSVAEDDNLMIYDTSAGVLKKVSKSNTTTLASPTFSSVSPDNSQTADGGNITFTITGSGFTAGTNARLIGASGQRLNFTSVTRTSTTSITATIARSSLLQAQSPYGIQVINGEGLAVTTASLITVDNIPFFNTAAGSLGTFTEGDSIDIEVSAYDPDSTSGITYELQSGSLPAGLSLVNESGDSCRIQGTASAVDADTTSNFTLRATDSASNTTSRAFSITIEDFALNGLRFDDGSSDYLNKTFGSSGNRKLWTWSCWLKRTTNSTNDTTFAGYVDANNRLRFNFNPNSIEIYGKISGTEVSVITTQVFRDVSAWYHFVWVMDTAQGTASDRMKIYVNGEQITSFSSTTYPSQNAESVINNNTGHFIGQRGDNSTWLSGYLAECVFIDGQALDPTSFGEFDEDTGIWKPIDVSGLTFGTNGFYLDFENSGSLGNDKSGNGNNFTVNNLTSIDQTTDTPTNNFATFNPLSKNDAGTVTFSNGNLTTAHTGTDSRYTSYSTLAVTQGKWYAEFKYDASSGGSDMMVGIGDLPEVENLNRQGNRLGQAGNTVGYYSGDGFKYVGPSDTASAYGNTYTVGDIIGVALDLDNGYVYFSKNGVWQNSGDPESGASGTGGISFITGNPFIIASSHVTTSSRTTTYSGNYGNPPFSISSGNSDGNGYGNFEYSVPSEYYALNTKNLAEYG